MTAMTDKAGVLIVLYNPDLKRLKENLDSITGQSSQILCIDNASDNLEEIKQLLGQYQGIALLKNQRNEGIAGALNRGMAYWKERGIHWVLSLDQDSVCPENLLGQLLKHTDTDAMLAIVCPKIFNEGQGVLPDKGVAQNLEKNLRWIEDTVTSGSLMKTEVWQALGGYDERFFIDFVDVDMCIRLIRGGYRILEDSSVVLEHQIGETFTRKLLGKTFIVRNHSAFRKYYIIRNSIFMYKKKELVRKNMIKFIIREMLLVLLYEKKKIAKLKRMCRGIADGIRTTI